MFSEAPINEWIKSRIPEVTINELSSGAQIVLASLVQASSLALEQLKPYLKHFFATVVDSPLPTNANNISPQIQSPTAPPSNISPPLSNQESNQV